MPSTGMIHVRVDEAEKNEAVAVLDSMGLSLSGVVRVLLKRVAQEKTVPFDLRVPNAATRAAMAEADDILRSGRARFSSPKDLFDALEKGGKR
jgi:DNA-damage-inducible protein J